MPLLGPGRKGIVALAILIQQSHSEPVYLKKQKGWKRKDKVRTLPKKIWVALMKRLQSPTMSSVDRKSVEGPAPGLPTSRYQPLEAIGWRFESCG